MAEMEAIWRTGMELEAADEAEAMVEGLHGGNEGVARATEMDTPVVMVEMTQPSMSRQQRREAVRIAVAARELARAA